MVLEEMKSPKAPLDGWLRRKSLPPVDDELGLFVGVGGGLEPAAQVAVPQAVHQLDHVVGRG